jgi:AraC-like DNA-binding protein
MDGDANELVDAGEPRMLVREGYAEHAPPPDLAKYVNCFWTSLVSESGGSAAPVERRVLPDGCVDIIVGFGRSRPGEIDTSEVTETIGVGSMTRALVITGETARLHIGVRFAPGCAFAAFGIPAAELTDETVNYGLIERDAAAAVDALAAELTDEGRLAAMVGLVRKRLARASVVPASVRVAVRRLSAASGNVRVAGLAGEIGITRQQLARQFATHVGVTPKTFARVMRAQAALARADAARAAYPRDVDWSAIAYELGYYDQAHFIDDFKELTGVTPGKWNPVG